MRRACKKKHAGIDISAVKGESVYAANPGIVRAIVDGGTQWEKAVTIEHTSSDPVFTTVYWHIDPAVEVGQEVTSGQVIGNVADLGDNTHFHFGVRMSAYSNISNRGALPQTDCEGDPAFPEHFVDPLGLYYNYCDNSVILNLSVYNSNTGDPVDEVDIIVGNSVKQTNSNGDVTFSELAKGAYEITISASGYEPYHTTINLNNTGATSASYGLIPAVSSPAGKPVVIDVTSYYSSRNKQALFLDGVDCNLAFSANVNWNGKTPDRVRFITPGNTIEETTGSHTFNIGQDFGVGGRLTVIAVSQDGTESDPFDANIEVMPLPPGLPVVPGIKNDGSSFSYKIEIKDSYSFFTDILPVEGLTVSSDIPIFGDKQLSLGIGADITAIIGSDGTATYSVVKPGAGENGFKMAGVAFDTGWQLGGDINFKYIENEDAWRFDGGYMTSAMSVEKGIGPSYTVVVVGPVPVPVYLRGELGAELNGGIGFTGWAEGEGWQLDGTLGPGADGKAIAGVGVASALAVEGYLGIDASTLFGFPEEPVFREANVALSGGISLVTFFFTYEKPIWEYTWMWPEAAGASSLEATALRQPMTDIRDLDWKPLPRNYTGGMTEKSAGIRTMSVTRTPISGTEQTIPDQIDIYPYSYPDIVTMGDDLLLAWITDDLTKTENNRTSVVYSKYSGDQWSTPAKIYEDGTADFYPTMAAITGGAVAAWQDSKIVFEANATMDDMLPYQEISASRYDSATGTWEAGSRLTANIYLDRSPVVASSGDKAALVWISNEQNDMLGSAEKPNNLKCSFFDGSAWSQEATVATGLKAIIKTALAYNETGAQFVFVADDDGDISTVTDQDLYLTTFDGTIWSAPTKLTDDDIQDTNPQLAYDSNGDLLLVWYKNGNFKMAKNLDMANSQTVVAHELSSGAADFRLAVGGSNQISIVWPDSSPKGQDIYMAMYDPNLNIWGKGMMITDTDSMERSLAPVQATDGSINIVYNKVETTTTTRQVEVGGNIVDVLVPGAGKTDLCMAHFPVEGDLAVNADSIGIMPAEIILGGALDITATVFNSGLKAAENIPVELYYGNPADGGTLIGEQQIITGPLAPGNSAQVSVTGWEVPAAPDVSKDIYVVVDPDLGYEDSNRSNNVAGLSIFKPELEVAQMFWQAMGPVKRAITVSVKNSGAVPAGNIPVIINKQDASGTLLLHQENLETLAVGESMDVVFVWDTTGEQTTGGYLKALAEVNKDEIIPEPSYINNRRTIQILGAMPGAVVNPSIASGTTGVSVKPALDWDDVSGAISYDLYIWKQEDPKPGTPTAAGLTESRYTMQGSLIPQTTYSWQVIAKNSSGETKGPEWTFTTKEIIAGDINDDGDVDLTDAILTLQVIVGMDTGQTVYEAADVNGDGKIGIEEVIYILQKVAGLRN